MKKKKTNMRTGRENSMGNVMAWIVVVGPIRAMIGYFVILPLINA